MKRLATLFTQSYEEMRKPRTITACAMFAAAAVVLGYFTISVGNYVKIGFSGIPNVLVGCLFGPAAGGFFGGFMDLFKYIVKPTGAFFPGFTVNAVLGGVIYGCSYYQRRITLVRVFATKLLVILVRPGVYGASSGPGGEEPGDVAFRLSDFLYHCQNHGNCRDFPGDQRAGRLIRLWTFPEK